MVTFMQFPVDKLGFRVQFLFCANIIALRIEPYNTVLFKGCICQFIWRNFEYDTKSNNLFQGPRGLGSEYV